jgi:hypothetical protein
VTKDERIEIIRRGEEVLKEILEDPKVREELRKWTAEEDVKDHRVPRASDWLSDEA